jgi:hypothetical protein
MLYVRLILLLTLAATGCQMFQRKHEVKTVIPKLSTDISREELVAYLNAQSEGLRSWRCNDTDVEANIPKMPDQRLKGTFHCAWPSHFRLDASNVIGIHANLGSNDDICWAYMQPGESVVMTWKHEDAYLLQYIPDGIPRLEPEWLLTILGIQPLDPERYQLTSAPEGSRELWLAAIETAPDGSSLRRVIKVDPVNGVAREHALYDSNKNLVLRAQLKDHKNCGHYRLPHTVIIDFPANKTRLTMRFTGIQPDCELSENLWQPPHSPQIQYMDVGEIIRREMPSVPQNQVAPKFNTPADSQFIGFADPESDAALAEGTLEDDPFFDDEVAAAGVTPVRPTGAERYFDDEPIPVPEFDRPAPPKKRSLFSNPFRRKRD